METIHFPLKYGKKKKRKKMFFLFCCCCFLTAWQFSPWLLVLHFINIYIFYLFFFHFRVWMYAMFLAEGRLFGYDCLRLPCQIIGKDFFSEKSLTALWLAGSSLWLYRKYPTGLLNILRSFLVNGVTWRNHQSIQRSLFKKKNVYNVNFCHKQQYVNLFHFLIRWF